MEIYSHPYQFEADFRRMRCFLIKARAGGHVGYWHVGDLTWRLFLQKRDGDPGRHIRLWESANGALLGFAGYYSACQSFDLQVHPEYKEDELTEEMLDWIESSWRNDSHTGEDACLSTDEGIYKVEAYLIDRLEQRGFEPRVGNSALFVRPLDETIPAPPLPEGFSLRAVAGEYEAEERSAVHRETFGSKRMTPEHYRRLMREPGYNPGLDLIAVSPEGRFAAFCIGWIDPVNCVGEFEPVGTHPEFRRMGLGRAVLLESMRRMKQLGMRQVIVGPTTVELAPFYCSAGFKEKCKTIHFYKLN